jgi:hypothetical protein
MSAREHVLIPVTAVRACCGREEHAGRVADLRVSYEGVVVASAHSQ